jgi:hypothetical protein
MYLLKSFLLICCITLASTSVAGEYNGSETEAEETTANKYSEIRAIWETGGLEETDISLKAFFHALSGYDYIRSTSGQAVGDHLVIIDYSLPSDRERLVVYDVKENRIAYTSLVAHGRNSGEHMATSFSNRLQSYQSSLGFYLTAETYQGKHGYSLRLDGLEDGFNDNARQRAVVMHAADYATRDFITRHGRLGRSLGCPSMPPAVSDEIITHIKENNVLFIYADDDDYLGQSEIINGSDPVPAYMTSTGIH